jgi:hypothetical protein
MATLKTITFDAPTAFTDSSALPSSGIAKYEYGFSQTKGGPYTKIVVDTDFTADANGKQTAQVDVSGFAFGTWYVAARDTTTAQFGGATSVWSNEISFTVDPKTPEAPKNFSIA